MELSQISKTRKKGRGPQAANQRIMAEAPAFPAKVPDELVTRVAAPAPDVPKKPSVIRKPRVGNPALAVAGVLGVAGGGAYLAHRQSQKRLGKTNYQKRRLERSLS